VSSGPLIAIVDNEPAVRHALAELVRVMGFEARAFPSAEALLTSPLPFDLVITDVHMDGLSGLDLVETLSRTRPGLPVIVITARDEPASAARAERAGAMAYLQKPVSQTVLTRHLASALGEP
jgi:two-component system response regulator FixJ